MPGVKASKPTARRHGRSGDGGDRRTAAANSCRMSERLSTTRGNSSKGSTNSQVNEPSPEASGISNASRSPLKRESRAPLSSQCLASSTAGSSDLSVCRSSCNPATLAPPTCKTRCRESAPTRDRFLLPLAIADGGLGSQEQASRQSVAPGGRRHEGIYEEGAQAAEPLWSCLRLAALNLDGGSNFA